MKTEYCLCEIPAIDESGECFECGKPDDPAHKALATWIRLLGPCPTSDLLERPKFKGYIYSAEVCKEDYFKKEQK